MRLPATFFAALLIAAAPAGAMQPSLDRQLSGIQWLADTGERLSFDQLKGRVIVMTMGYSGCRKTCSTSVLVLKELQSLLDRTGKQADFVVVTYDPQADTPEAWRQYRKARDLTRANWHFLSGSEGDTRRMARFLDLAYWHYDEHIVHDFRIVLFDREGRWHREIVWQTQRDLEHLFDDL
jgi:protein SCO1/2